MLRTFIGKLTGPRRIQLLYAGILFLLLVILIAGIKSFNTYRETIDERRRVSFARAEGDALLSSLKDAEAGCRGFLFARDSAYLKPYHQAEHEAPMHLNDLDRVLADTLERRWIGRLRSTSMTALLSNRTLIKMEVDSSGSQRPLPVRLDDSRIAMEDVRAVHDSLDMDLGKKQLVLDEEEVALGWTTPFMLVLYACLAILSTAILFRWLFNALAKAEAAEREIQHKVGELDKAVVTRENAERSLRRVLDSSISGIMAFRSLRNDMNEVVDMEWTMINNRGLELLGHNDEDLVGRKLRDVLPREQAATFFAHSLSVVESGRPVRATMHYNAAGIDREFEISAVKQADGSVMTFTDITEQVRRDELAQESERLALTGRIARTVAHEVRNPLTNVRLAMDELRDGSLSGDEASLYWDIARRNTDRIGQLITEMLASSKQVDLKLVPVDMMELLKNAIDRVKDRLELKRIRLEWAIEEPVPKVMVDPEKMELALVNLCINAIEAMEPHTGVLRLSVVDPGDVLTLQIVDNGKGIAPEEQDKLFESFYTGRPGGMGLGLTTARSILNSHFVHVELESELGKGTTFNLTFSQERVVREVAASALSTGSASRDPAETVPSGSREADPEV